MDVTHKEVDPSSLVPALTRAQPLPNRPWQLVLPILLAFVVIAGACSSRATPKDGGAHSPVPDAHYAGEPLRVDGLTVPASSSAQWVQLAINGSFQPRFWPGVNIGSTVPGTQPGAVAATRADYDRMLAESAALGARVVRVYTILRPAFYDAVLAWNRAHPTTPIYVMHGVWISEPEFLASQDAWSKEVTRKFQSELSDAVAVIHGDATIPFRRGHASGNYHSNISPWLLAWSIGVEWDQIAVRGTDRAHPKMPPFRGKFVVALPTATPMESWLASMLDHTAALDAERGWSRPLTFTNWLTLDPLEHPSEPLPQEDMVSVDAMHIRATAKWPGGGFIASYHAYPYYPDFLKTTESYAQYRPASGRIIDPYAGYLHDLRAHHLGQAVMITEFGQPTSLGLAHTGPLGRDQGGHSERGAAHANAELMRVVRSEGYAGGIVFELADEWFKSTWNIVNNEVPADRRSLWRNVWNNEEYFGVLAIDAGATRTVKVDGSDREWGHNSVPVI